MTITGLKPDENTPIHPHAVKRVNQCWAEIVEEVPILKNLTNDEIEADLQSYLTDEEFQKYKKCLKKIVEWLQECKSTVNQFSSIPYCTWIIDPMYDMKLLIKKAYKEKEEEARFINAVKKLDPPHEIAKLYLLSEELKKYKYSIADAANAYMDKGEEYFTDHRAKEYLNWIDEINSRIEEKKKEKEAEKTFWELNHLLNYYITELESQLSQQAQNIEVYFRNRIKDLRYTNYHFAGFLSDESRHRCENIIKNKVHQIVPPQFDKFISCPYSIHYFLLPLAEYHLEDGIPCLYFYFEVFAVFEVKVWLKPGEVTINGYKFNLPQIQHESLPTGGYWAPLKAPKFLGYHYILLSASELGNSLWQNIPLVLLQGLLKGEHEPASVTISAAWEGGTDYLVEGYDDEITIPDDFSQYLREIGEVSNLEKLGIISKKVGKVIPSKVNQVINGKSEITPQNKHDAGFSHEEFISSITGLGIGKKCAEDLHSSIPKNLSLKEAISYAMKLYGETAKA